ncbi:hypothetical protein MRX96_043261 [Rhipicephalus microplus]
MTDEPGDPLVDFSGTTTELPTRTLTTAHNAPGRLGLDPLPYATADTQAVNQQCCPAQMLFVTSLLREYDGHWLKFRSHHGAFASSARHPSYQIPDMPRVQPQKSRRPGPERRLHLTLTSPVLSL